MRPGRQVGYVAKSISDTTAPERPTQSLVHLRPIIATFRAPRLVQDKARCAGKGHPPCQAPQHRPGPAGGLPSGEPLVGHLRCCALLKGGGPSGESAPGICPASDSLKVAIIGRRCTRRLSDYGGRSEASGESSSFFRSFEANSGDYLTRMSGKMGRFPAAAVDHP